MKPRARRVSPGALAVLQAIIEYKLECDGNSPSAQELADATNYHVQSIKRHLYQLSLAERITFIGPRHIIVHDGLWLQPDFVRNYCLTCPYLTRRE